MLLSGLEDSEVQLLALGIAELCALADGVPDDKGLVDYLQQLRTRAGVPISILIRRTKHCSPESNGPVVVLILCFPLPIRVTLACAILLADRLPLLSFSRRLCIRVGCSGEGTTGNRGGDQSG